jgi:hypothetical protein
VPGALSLEVKRPEREADHPPPSSTEFKNAWSHTATPQYAFMKWLSVNENTAISLYVVHLMTWRKDGSNVDWLRFPSF